MKTVYLYDENYVYAGDYNAQEDPLAPGSYIVPTLSTSAEPPSYNAQQIPVFTKGVWIIEADYIGETWFNSATGDPVVITELGIPPSNLQPTQPVFAPTAGQNKSTASGLLSATDWTTIADVADPINSPYLTNQAEFIFYRNLVRQIAVYPVAGYLVWPVAPIEVWL